jgi:tRNA dimethylallyltransferase
MNIAILGPTASGKTALAVEVAKRIGGCVVNGDPFQAYRDIPIGTGQPTQEEKSGVTHVGYGVLPLSARTNPKDFGVLVRQWLSDCPSGVLVTGSGLYLRGIWDQLSNIPDVPESVEIRVRGWSQRLTTPALHRFLRAVDPARAAELHPNDSSRIQRALCLHLTTGRRPSEFLTGIQRGVPEGWRALIVLPFREMRRERVARRCQAMVDAGWQEEVRRAVSAGREADLRDLRPLGYDIWMDGGDPSSIVMATQAYAKRQVTFFLRQWPEIPVWDPDTEPIAGAFERLELN